MESQKLCSQIWKYKRVGSHYKILRKSTDEQWTMDQKCYYHLNFSAIFSGNPADMPYLLTKLITLKFSDRITKMFLRISLQKFHMWIARYLEGKISSYEITLLIIMSHRIWNYFSLTHSCIRLYTRENTSWNSASTWVHSEILYN